jgi:acyl-CoA reductase-like NAD-dependent aldehyde dehydrogenase
MGYEMSERLHLFRMIQGDPNCGLMEYSPVDEHFIGFAPRLSIYDLDKAVEDARVAKPAFEALSHEERSKLLREAADAIWENRQDLADILSWDLGKPYEGPNVGLEITACCEWLRAVADTPFETQEIAEIKYGYAISTYRALGVVGVIGSSSWPMFIMVCQIAAALRMGNAVVVSTVSAPFSALAVVHLMKSVFPKDVLQVVPGLCDVDEALMAHPGFDKIMLAGSAEDGKKLAQASASNLARLTMVLGGNDAGIVLDDADPKVIAKDLFWGAFMNVGQSGAALKRLYVADSIYDEIVDALVEVAKTMQMGKPWGDGVVLGPLYYEERFEAVDGLVKAALKRGAKIALGGRPNYRASGFFYPITILAEVDPDDPVVVEDQCGPVLPVVRYGDVEDAIFEANKLDVGLGSSVWSSNVDRAMEVASRLVAGTTWINSHGWLDPNVPFGGVKGSGYGVWGGVEGLKELARQHVVHIWVIGQIVLLGLVPGVVVWGGVV